MVGIVTETWLTDGETLQGDITDLALGTGIGLICKNRPPNSRGFSHGGVAVAYRKSSCKMQEISLPNPDNFEVLVTIATIPGYARKLLTIACYIPPGYDVGRGRACLAYIEDVVLDLKRKYKDPFVVLGGDFNQWLIQDCLLYTSPSPRDKRQSRMPSSA